MRFDNEHYAGMEIQPWDGLKAWLTREQFAGYMVGTAIVYLARFNVAALNKGGLRDVKKALHHLQKLVEVEEEHLNRNVPEFGMTESVSDYESAVIRTRQSKGRPL